MFSEIIVFYSFILIFNIYILKFLPMILLHTSTMIPLHFFNGKKVAGVITFLQNDWLSSSDGNDLTSPCCKERLQNKYHHKLTPKTFLNTFFLCISILLPKQKRGKYPPVSVVNTHSNNSSNVVIRKMQLRLKNHSYF